MTKKTLVPQTLAFANIAWRFAVECIPVWLPSRTRCLDAIFCRAVAGIRYLWGVTVGYQTSRLVGAILLAGFAAAVAAFACCIFPLVFPALSNTSTEAVAFLFTLRCLAIAALGFSFSLIYASKIAPPEWAHVLLWFGIFFVAVETTVSWWYPSVAPGM